MKLGGKYAYYFRKRRQLWKTQSKWGRILTYNLAGGNATEVVESLVVPINANAESPVVAEKFFSEKVDLFMIDPFS